MQSILEQPINTNETNENNNNNSSINHLEIIINEIQDWLFHDESINKVSFYDDINDWNNNQSNDLQTNNIISFEQSNNNNGIMNLIKSFSCILLGDTTDNNNANPNSTNKFGNSQRSVDYFTGIIIHSFFSCDNMQVSSLNHSLNFYLFNYFTIN